MLAASGEYIQHIDADDWVDKKMISTMYKKSKAENADVVACDFYTVGRNVIKHQVQFHPTDHEELLVLFLRNKIVACVWNKLIRRKLCLDNYQALKLSKFISHAEDNLITIPLYCSTPQIFYVNKPLYYHNKLNTQAITQQNYSIKDYKDRLFLYEILYRLLKNRLNKTTLALLRERLALDILNTALWGGQKPDWDFLARLHFDFRVLWFGRGSRWKHKVVYSFYFLHLSKVPQKLQQIRQAIRKKWRANETD